MSVFHGRDDGIFQLSVPVGSQHRVLRRLDACLGYDAPSVSASVTYRDDVHAPAVYGGSVQRRDVCWKSLFLCEKTVRMRITSKIPLPGF
jgi:hypothetical protein